MARTMRLTRELVDLIPATIEDPGPDAQPASLGRCGRANALRLQLRAPALVSEIRGRNPHASNAGRSHDEATHTTRDLHLGAAPEKPP